MFCIVFNPYSSEDAYFVVAAHADPTDVEVPQIRTPESDIPLNTTFLVVVFGCLGCEVDFVLKVMLSRHGLLSIQYLLSEHITETMSCRHYLWKLIAVSN